jgi:hypothetical protein
VLDEFSVAGDLAGLTSVGNKFFFIGLPTSYQVNSISNLTMRDFIQANVETNVKQNEELSKRAIPGVLSCAETCSGSLPDRSMMSDF